MSHCTYLLKENALANNSILYSKFKVINELKQIRINDRKLELFLNGVMLTVDLEDGIIHENNRNNYRKEV